MFKSEGAEFGEFRRTPFSLKSNGSKINLISDIKTGIGISHIIWANPNSVELSNYGASSTKVVSDNIREVYKTATSKTDSEIIANCDGQNPLVLDGYSIWVTDEDREKLDADTALKFVKVLYDKDNTGGNYSSYSQFNEHSILNFSDNDITNIIGGQTSNWGSAVALYYDLNTQTGSSVWTDFEKSNFQNGLMRRVSFIMNCDRNPMEGTNNNVPQICYSYTSETILPSNNVERWFGVYELATATDTSRLLDSNGKLTKEFRDFDWGSISFTDGTETVSIPVKQPNLVYDNEHNSYYYNTTDSWKMLTSGTDIFLRKYNRVENNEPDTSEEDRIVGQLGSWVFGTAFKPYFTDAGITEKQYKEYAKQCSEFLFGLRDDYPTVFN